MHNGPYPFNQNQHIFDFKVKVNFQNGNVSLTAPQIVSPPAHFNHNQNRQPIYGIPNNNNIPPNYQPHIYSSQAVPQRDNQFPVPYSRIPTQSHNNNLSIEMVNSSYTSIKSMNSPHRINQLPATRMGSAQNQQNIICDQQSCQIIECVICQKQFSVEDFDKHLEFHKNRYGNNGNGKYSGQKTKNTSGYMLTQNSVNEDESSDMSYVSNSSVGQNISQKQLSEKSSKSNRKDRSAFSFQKSQQIQQSNKNSGNFNNGFNENILPYQNAQKQIIQGNNTEPQEAPLLGRINNPIQVLRQNQSSLLSDSSLSITSRSGNIFIPQSTPSLNYSNNSEQNPFQPQNISYTGSILIPNNDSNSFGYQKRQFFPQSQIKNQHNNSSNNISQASRQSESSQGFMPQPHHMGFSRQDNQNRVFFKGQQRIGQGNVRLEQQMNGKTHQSNNSQQFSSNGHASYHSKNSSNSRVLFEQAPQRGIQQFRTIQSRYLPQNHMYSNQLSHSQNVNSIMSREHIVNNKKPNHNNNSYHSEGFDNFLANDSISSISGNSRIYLNESSDYLDLQQHNLLSKQNSNTNSNIHLNNHSNSSINRGKNSQVQTSFTKKPEQNSQKRGRQLGTQENFQQKKEKYMISSATSYYEKKFKDGESSSDEEQQLALYKSARLSYASRLRQKHESDRNQSNSCTCHQSKQTKNLQKSSKMNTSNTSNTSKAKLPLNYLARQDFISTSSKSTHKSTKAD